MTPQFEEFRVHIANAVRQAAAELRSKNGELFGFAFCTDDDLSTFYHVACSREWVREKEAGYPDIGFISVEWTLSTDHEPFDVVSRQFAKFANDTYPSDEDWSEARDQRFNLLVSALRDCRGTDTFAPDTLLCVGGTDPSDHLEALAMHGVDALNTPAIADRYGKALGYAKYRSKT